MSVRRRALEAGGVHIYRCRCCCRAFTFGLILKKSVILGLLLLLCVLASRLVWHREGDDNGRPRARDCCAPGDMGASVEALGAGALRRMAGGGIGAACKWSQIRTFERPLSAGVAGGLVTARRGLDRGVSWRAQAAGGRRGRRRKGSAGVAGTRRAAGFGGRARAPLDIKIRAIVRVRPPTPQEACSPPRLAPSCLPAPPALPTTHHPAPARPHPARQGARKTSTSRPRPIAARVRDGCD